MDHDCKGFHFFAVMILYIKIFMHGGYEMRKNKHKVVEFLVFASPALILYCVFFILPLIGSALYSFTDWDGIQTSYHFIGLQNYIKMFSVDQEFIDSTIFTLKYALIYVISINIFGLLIALLVNHKFRSRGFVRTAIFSPNVLSLIIVGFIWNFMFRTISPQLGEALHIPFLQTQFLASFDNIVFVVAFVAVWQGVGLIMLIYLAGLQNVPVELKEAMIVDGANGSQLFFHLTLPMIIPSIISNIFITTTAGLKVFDMVLALTNGGPGNSSESLAINIYRESFTANSFGSGSAKAVFFCLIVLVITTLQIKYLKSKEVVA
jgi:raffinose/stachyose/melibiose transport system permease protein